MVSWAFLFSNWKNDANVVIYGNDAGCEQIERDGSVGYSVIVGQGLDYIGLDVDFLCSYLEE